MRLFVFKVFAGAGLLLLPVITFATEETVLEEVVVTATLRPQSLQDVPSSVTVLDSQTLKDTGQQHFQDVLGLVPNLNWAAGTSRPRYFQIRGVGELDQYQGAPNPSVGFLVDDIDFSGLGGLATLIDVDQIEVLHGPQGTSYGANALAGLIKVKTRDPKPVYELTTEASTATYGACSLGLVAGGPMSIGGSDSAFRFVAEKYRSDGFIKNDYLGRDDTNGFDETTLRGKTRFDLGSELQLDISGLYINQDNGYDAWSLDSSRITKSGNPGRDAQRSKAIDAHATYKGWAGLNLESITTYADTNQVYNFDADWGNDQFWLSPPYSTAYNYFSDFLRGRITRSQEFRFTSKNEAKNKGDLAWVSGLYVMNLSEKYKDSEFSGSPTPYVVDSAYSATNAAMYGQVDYKFSERSVVSFGVRDEYRTTDYSDTEGTAFSPDENLVGGSISIEHELSDGHNIYLTISRGYKAGGVNIGQGIEDNLRSFSKEILWGAEVGDRSWWLSNQLSTDVSLFYMKRIGEQVVSSLQDSPTNPARYVFITDNADHGVNYGVEADINYKAMDHLNFFSTVSLLQTHIYGYQRPRTTEVIDGREQAHSPKYQFSVGADWHSPSGLMARIDVTGKGSFYFDTSHDQVSSPYQLLNAKVGYESDKYAFYLWGNNLLDKNYAIRGFYFGNEPPDWSPKLYLQKGDPRQIGITANWNF